MQGGAVCLNRKGLISKCADWLMRCRLVGCIIVTSCFCYGFCVILVVGWAANELRSTVNDEAKAAIGNNPKALKWLTLHRSLVNDHLKEVSEKIVGNNPKAGHLSTVN
jgi:hypothetical protein